MAIKHRLVPVEALFSTVDLLQSWIFYSVDNIIYIQDQLIV